MLTRKSDKLCERNFKWSRSRGNWRNMPNKWSRSVSPDRLFCFVSWIFQLRSLLKVISDFSSILGVLSMLLLASTIYEVLMIRQKSKSNLKLTFTINCSCFHPQKKLADFYLLFPCTRMERSFLKSKKLIRQTWSTVLMALELCRYFGSFSGIDLTAVLRFPSSIWITPGHLLKRFII